MRPPRCLDKQ